MGSLMNSNKHLRKKIIPVLYSPLQKTETENIPNSPCETSITLVLKPDKDIIRKENYKPTSLMNLDAKILNKILAN